MSQSITILSDQITTVPLVFENSSNAIISPIAGDTFSAVSSSASLLATVIGANTLAGPAVQLTPVVRSGSGYVVTVLDAGGLPAITLNVTITPDPALATQWSLNVGSPTTAPQSIPSNPGP